MENPDLIERMKIGRDIRTVYGKILWGERWLDHHLEPLLQKYEALGGRSEDQINRARIEFGEEVESCSWAAHDASVCAERVVQAERVKREWREEMRQEQERQRVEKAEQERERGHKQARCDLHSGMIGGYSSGVITEYTLNMGNDQIERLFREHDVNWDTSWGEHSYYDSSYYQGIENPECPLTLLQGRVLKIVGQVGGSVADICDLTGIDKKLVGLLVFGLYRRGFLWRHGDQWIARNEYVWD